MKYFYLICLILSSLFTYKYSSAETYLQYAFFIPENAFQQNNTETPDINIMRPRYKKQQVAPATDNSESPTRQLPPIRQRKKVQPVMPPVVLKKVLPVTTAQDTPTTENQQINKPTITTAQPTAPSLPVEATTQKDLSAIQEIAAQYTLEEPTPIQNTAQATPPLAVEQSVIKKLEQENLNTLLSRIPFPDYKQPKFKQLYSIYGLELRSLREREKLPNNPRQEEVLAKANSLLRFKVK